MKRKIFYLGALALIVAGGIFWSCQKDDVLTNPDGLMLKNAVLENCEGPEVEPVLFPDLAGNAEAECAATDVEGEGACWFYALKVDGWGEDGAIMNGDYVFTDPNDPTITNTITISGDNGYTFFWESEMPVCKVIVKGGTDANVYYYEGAFSDCGLIAPLNSGGQQAKISHVTFCFYEGPGDEPECEWIGETAWADGSRYVKRGNWATYTPYVANSTVKLYAGQTMEAGTVTFSAVVDGEVTITIALNDGWRLERTEEDENIIIDEAVKVQGYNAIPPKANPAPGLFTTYKGTELEFTVDYFKFYGVHVNVEWENCED